MARAGLVAIIMPLSPLPYGPVTFGAYLATSIPFSEPQLVYL